MSEMKSNFFRPWDISETTNEASGIVTVDNILHNVPCNRREDDDESVVSSATSTSSTSSTIVEISGKYDGHLSDRGTADSTSSNDARTKDEFYSESFDDVATSTTLSLEDVICSNVAPYPTNESRAFLSQQSFDSKTSVTLAIPAQDSNKFNGSGDVNPLEYLPALEFRRPEGVVPISNGTYSVALPDITRLSAAAMIPDLYYTFPEFYPGIHRGMHPGIDPGIHAGIDSGIHAGILSPGRFYNRSVEKAVQMVHQQDAVAKQMKKMRPKKFRCHHCDVAFSNNGQLKGHIRIHTGERPFKCEVVSCGKSFTRNEELTRHKRIHTGVRPHSCGICGKRFGRKDHLKKHMRTHEMRDSYRVSAAALSVLAISQLQQAAGIPPYIY